MQYINTSSQDRKKVPSAAIGTVDKTMSRFPKCARLLKVENKTRYERQGTNKQTNKGLMIRGRKEGDVKNSVTGRKGHVKNSVTGFCNLQNRGLSLRRRKKSFLQGSR